MNSQQSPTSAIGGANPHGAMLGFVVRMLVYYGVLHALYFLIPIAILHDQIYLQVFGRPSVGLIQLMAPAEGVSALANRIASPRAILEIVRGCDGSGVLFLISAAVIAFPASWRMRAIGVFLGALLVYALNLARLSGLYFVAAYHLPWFLPLHTYFIPSLLIVIVALFFMWWVAHASARRV
jgi:exosortase family protein XrtM